MTYLLLAADLSIVDEYPTSGDAPELAEGQQLREAPMTYPDGYAWDAALDGFYEILTYDQWTAIIDDAAGAARAKYITIAPGQDMTYLRKESEARAWLAEAGQDLSTTAYSFLKGECETTGATPEVSAATIIANADQWAVVGSMIETLRLTAKRAVAAAATQYEREAVVAAIVWP